LAAFFFIGIVSSSSLNFLLSTLFTHRIEPLQIAQLKFPAQYIVVYIQMCQELFSCKLL
jgi:hypothetical protein